ncbi:hypothetical protein [Lacrimispora sp. JR3]|uniref:hypothetical protein n=1 Tax=Lacrimispora sinapis TaxID=3111456 RepID=UPI0037499D91
MISADLLTVINKSYSPKKGLGNKDFSSPASDRPKDERVIKVPDHSSGYKMYLKKGALYSGGNGTGLSYYLEYAEGSTKENPLVTAKGVDENGDEFEQTISINDINPKNATIVELQSLASHYGIGEKIMGLSSLPAEIRNAGRTDRVNLFKAFDKGIKDFQTVGRHDLEALYKKNYNTYLELFESLGKE